MKFTLSWLKDFPETRARHADAGRRAEWMKTASPVTLALAGALLLAGCQGAPEAVQQPAGPNTVTYGSTTITTGGAVRVEGAYVGG